MDQMTGDLPQTGLPSEGDKHRLGLGETEQEPIELPGPEGRRRPPPVLGPRDLRLVRYFKRQGFRNPYRMVRCLRAAGIKPQTAAALITMETGNGRNVYGSDNVGTGGCYSKGGAVTRGNYACYKRFRGAGACHGRCQGVGPAQLTWFSFQDRADDLGGCPHPFWNMLVGFEIIKAHVDGGASIWNAYKAYNGAGPYADRAVSWRDEWQRRLKAAGF